jgi:hypothetical protein
MRDKAKIDLWISVLLWSMNIFYIVLFFVIPLNELWVYAVFIVPVIIMMIWILIGSYYELREDYLYMRIGPFFGRIKYENIKSLTLKNNLLSSMAMSYHRIEIKEHKKSYLRGTTFIGPQNREEFYEELKRLCRNLEK